MKILFDTNIVLDVLLSREEFVEQSALLFAAVERKEIAGYLSATTITTLDYLTAKAIGGKRSRETIQRLLKIFILADVNSTVVINALNSSFSDFEDAVQYHSGINAQVDGFVTRNKKDFKQAEHPIYSPGELLAVMRVTSNKR